MNTVGCYGLGQIPGFAGFMVKIGQFFYSWKWSQWTHAFIVLDDNTVLEAEPGGARITPISEYNVPAGRIVNIPLTDEQRSKIVEKARTLVGTPYSILDYFSIALHRLHIRPKIVVDRVMSMDHLICSELIDYVYDMCGIHLFDDGRIPGDVAPIDLAQLADEKGW